MRCRLEQVPFKVSVMKHEIGIWEEIEAGNGTSEFSYNSNYLYIPDTVICNKKQIMTNARLYSINMLI